MFSYIWPIALVIISNVVYQVCAKSVTDTVSPFITLTVTYLVSAAVSTAMFFLLGKGRSFTGEITKVNWASYVLGIVIVGLEVGFIYAYQAGWEVSVASTVQSAFVALGLIFVGALLYGETITLNRIIGIGLCLVGLMFIERG